VLEPAAGYRLGYRVDTDTERVCVGHVPFRKGRGDFHDCARSPRPGSRTCERCAIAEATLASNLHHAHTRGMAELDPAVADHLMQPNRLYVAGFRDGSFKIGTSTASRLDRRLEEQGAWVARLVAETRDGMVVRELEDAVTDRLGLAQSVSASRKLRGLAAPLDDDELSARLATHAAAVIARVVGPAADERLRVTDDSWRHPMADEPVVRRLIEYPLRMNRGRHDLEVVTAVGRHLVVRRPDGDDLFVLDPAPLFGLWLDIGDHGSDEIAIQDSLF